MGLGLGKNPYPYPKPNFFWVPLYGYDHPEQDFLLSAQSPFYNVDYDKLYVETMGENYALESVTHCYHS